MARSIDKAKYRILPHEFWSDWRILFLSRNKKVDEISLIVYSITSTIACYHKSISGIYQVDLDHYDMYRGLSTERCSDAFNFLNTKFSEILQYDFKSGTIFLKSFFGDQIKYKPGVSVVSGLLQGYKETFSIAPDFWQEFSGRNKELLGELFTKLIESKDTNLLEEDREEQKKFLVTLIELKDKILDPTNDPKSPFAQKVLSEQKTLF